MWKDRIYAQVEQINNLNTNTQAHIHAHTYEYIIYVLYTWNNCIHICNALYLFRAESLWNTEVLSGRQDQKLVGKGFLQLNKYSQ